MAVLNSRRPRWGAFLAVVSVALGLLQGVWLIVVQHLLQGGNAGEQSGWYPLYGLWILWIMWGAGFVCLNASERLRSPLRWLYAVAVPMYAVLALMLVVILSQANEALRWWPERGALVWLAILLLLVVCSINFSITGRRSVRLGKWARLLLVALVVAAVSAWLTILIF